jgi:DprA winged helix domain
MRSFFAPHLRRSCAKIRRRPETLLPDVAGISRFESEGSLAMPLGVIILEGAQELVDYGAAGDDVWQEKHLVCRGTPRHACRELSAGAKLGPCREDVIEELPTLGRAALTDARPSAKKSTRSRVKRSRDPLPDIVKRTGLNSSDVLATLFDLGIEGLVRQLPGKQVS